MWTRPHRSPRLTPGAETLCLSGTVAQGTAVRSGSSWKVPPLLSSFILLPEEGRIALARKTRLHPPFASPTLSPLPRYRRCSVQLAVMSDHGDLRRDDTPPTVLPPGSIMGVSITTEIFERVPRRSTATGAPVGTGQHTSTPIPLTYPT